VNVLSPREGYRLWAPLYSRETPVSFLDDCLIAQLAVPTEGLSLLDAGCGIGRRMSETGASNAVGLDSSPEMLAEAHQDASLVCADVRSIPLATASFDVVWCRLVLGHIHHVAPVYAELARVCRLGGTVIVTDFHPDAVRKGHRRSFRDDKGAVREIEHHVHQPGVHIRNAEKAGLESVSRLHGAVGPLVRHMYKKAARLDLYHAHFGTRLVIAFAFKKT